MVWKETTTMEQKIEFINEWRSGNYSISELCRQFDISRPTAYKYIKRYEEVGLDGLNEKHRAPRTHPNKTPSNIEERVIVYRKKHPRWGGEKIWKLLHKDFKEGHIPSISTVNRILKRNGLITVKKRRRRVKPVYPIFDPQECNEVWSADFKGKFKMGNKRYCHPLTIADSYSRFVFSAKGLHGEKFKPTKLEFRRVFREFGLPSQIHTDNGKPFGAVQAIKRLTRLAVWFLELGIEPVYSDPAHPEQNGRHERMHQDLKGEATRPPGFNLRTQQRKLNHFVHEYNYERPHAALSLETPGSIHEYSARPYREKIEEWVYPSYCEVRRVCKNGALRWRSTKWVMVSTTLIDKYVGLEELGDGIWRIYFRQKMLGYFDEKTLRIIDELGRLKRNNV
jgi:transposase InsO family protein